MAPLNIHFAAEVKGRFHGPDLVTPGQRVRHPLSTRLGDQQNQSRHLEDVSPALSEI